MMHRLATLAQQASLLLLLMALAIGAGAAFQACRAAESATNEFDPSPIVSLLELVIDADPATAGDCLRTLAAKVQSGEVSSQRVGELKPGLLPLIDKHLDAPGELTFDAAMLACAWRDQRALVIARSTLVDSAAPVEKRQQALEALVHGGDEPGLASAGKLLADPSAGDGEFRAAVLGALGKTTSPATAEFVLAAFVDLEPELQPKAIELLTQRPSWSKRLLQAIAAKTIAAGAVNANQAGRLLASRDEELRQAAAAIWGSVRSERNPQREAVIVRFRAILEKTPAHPVRGQAVFQKVCGQCHTIHGVGQNVGPDITSNGRASFDQLLSNVFDPSLVIGAAYQAQSAITSDGRVLTGLLVENSEQRIVLKMQGGKTEVIPREEIEDLAISQLSLMPEGLESQLTEQEIVDLFGFLTLDRPPQDPEAKWIPGAPALSTSD